MTEALTDTYARDGIVGPISVFDENEVFQINQHIDRLATALPTQCSEFSILFYERNDSFIYDIAADSRIVNLVSKCIGEDVFLWCTHVFCKQPKDSHQVGWHQDIAYWPLRPANNSVTVWLALDNVSIDNGAVKFIAGSHKQGLVEHRSFDGEGGLEFHADIGEDMIRDVMVMELKKGQLSLHSDLVLHSSSRNSSKHRRRGLVIRYCTSNVSCDFEVWPDFRVSRLNGNSESFGGRVFGRPF